MNEPDSWADQPLIEPLTSRELDILCHMAENRSNREIAELLVLSLNTVKWYARQIYGKLGVSKRQQAVVRARELGLLTTGAPPALPPHNLPAQLTPFLGRRQMLAQISERMSEPTVRLVTVIGPGGMGKTRLAIEGASLSLEEHGDGFPHGAFLVRLDRVSNPALITSAIAQSIGFQFY